MDWNAVLQRVAVILVETLNILQIIAVTLLITVYGAIRACLPASVLGKKTVANEVVLVTGAGSGIGRLLALRFAKLGSKLVLWDVNQKGNEETKNMVQELGAEVYAYTCDITRREEVYRLAKQVKDEAGNVNILINNAGIVIGKNLMDCSDTQIERTMQVNALSHFWITKAFLPAMLEANHGHIVSISSGAGLIGNPGLADYCASKFAANGFAESLALELYKMGKRGIEFTQVCPFYINTGMFDGVASKYITILEPDYAADKIVEAILTNQKVLYMPRLIYPLIALKGLLPVEAAIYLGDSLGALDAMNTFKGRQPQNGSIH